MTAVPHCLEPPEGGWTTDDLDAMPDDGRRRELLEGSQSMDRITKPALYAQAGIPYYWRIETVDGALVVHTYRIDPLDEIYAQTGEWTTTIDLGEPFPLKLPVSRLTPRHL